MATAWPRFLNSPPRKKKINIGFGSCGIICPLCHGQMKRGENKSMLTGMSTGISSLYCAGPGFIHHSVQIDRWSRPTTIGFTLKFIVAVLCIQEGKTNIHKNGKLERVIDRIMTLEELHKFDRNWVLW